MKKIVKENKGITLLALVVTIVVLIILAGVAINLTLSQNGIFNKASEGKDKYEIASIRENVELELTALEIENIDKDPITIEAALIELSKKKIFDSIDMEGNTGFTGEYEVILKNNEKGKVKVEIVQKITGVRASYVLTPEGYTNEKNVDITFKVKGKVKSVIDPSGNKYDAKDNEITVTYNVKSNGKYTFKMINEEGKELEKEVIVNTIDTLEPKDFEISIVGEKDGILEIGENEERKIEIIANAQDAEATKESVCSQIDRYEYYIKSSTESQYTKYDTNIIEDVLSNNYDIYVIAYDKAGNKKESSVKSIKVLVIGTKIDLQNIEYTGDTNYLTKNEDGSVTLSAPSGWETTIVYINNIDFSKYSKISITYSYVAGYDWAFYLHTSESDNGTLLFRDSEKYKTLAKTTTIADILKDKEYSMFSLISNSKNAKLTVYDITLMK